MVKSLYLYDYIFMWTQQIFTRNVKIKKCAFLSLTIPKTTYIFNVANKKSETRTSYILKIVQHTTVTVKRKHTSESPWKFLKVPETLDKLSHRNTEGIPTLSL